MFASGNLTMPLHREGLAVTATPNLVRPDCFYDAHAQGRHEPRCAAPLAEKPRRIQIRHRLPSQLHKHDHIEHLPGCGASPGGRTISTISNRCPHSLPREHGQGSSAPIFAPVVDDMREDLGIRTGRYAVKKSPDLFVTRSRSTVARAMSAYFFTTCGLSNRLPCVPDEKQVRPPASCRRALHVDMVRKVENQYAAATVGGSWLLRPTII